ncbi:hypothetical protein [Celeribacter halophilus]|uniref:hypothetical protein n=1 Tax=Celeribacter halophilus TaxID=576117 RepID=UPI002FD2D052
MKSKIVTATLSALALVGCMEVGVGGSAPRYAMEYQPISGTVPSVPVDLTEKNCEYQAFKAEELAEERERKKYAQLNTQCTSGYFGNYSCQENVSTSGGSKIETKISNAGFKARKMEMSYCMAQSGYEAVSVCVKNCTQ